jgi:hypothetical protein
MAPRRIVVRKGFPGESSGRWRKAQEHVQAMELVLGEALFDSAAVLAIHAAIAACDAFTLRHRAERSSSGRHLDAVEVFARVSTIRGVKEAAGHLEDLLDEKSWIEYSDRSPRPEESHRLCEHARRFVDFVGKNLE